MPSALQAYIQEPVAQPALDRQLQAIQRVLQQQTPKESVRWRKGKGGRELPYASHVFVTQTLNEAFGWRWSFEVENEQILYVNEIPFEATCRGRLTVWLPGILDPVIKMQMGCQPIEMLKDSIKPVSLGDALKGAGSDALKKCASLLGIALDLYDSAHDARKNPTGEQLRAAADAPIETDANKIALAAQAPLPSQITPATRKALGDAIRVLRIDFGMRIEDLRAEMEAATGHSDSAALSEEQGRGVLAIYAQMADELRAERAPSAASAEEEINF